MLCTQCAKELATRHDRCSDCGGSAVLSAQSDGDWSSGRYTLDRVLGEGAFGTTYLASRLDDGRAVCIKELTVRKMGSFQQEKLFRREGEILKQLKHSRIPSYVDHFVAGTGKYVSLYLVQELVNGKNLTEELPSRRYREDQVLALGIELLEILDYLHSLSPAVVHRDIKPSNVMRRASDGKLVLVDFGSVKDVARELESGGSTVAGTFGFMPPEQFYGKAAPASDLYALGVLMVVLLSRKDPADMLDGKHQLSWEPHVNVSPATRGVLRRLLEPELARRPTNAAAALPLLTLALAGPALANPAATPSVALTARAPSPLERHLADVPTGAEPDPDHGRALWIGAVVAMIVITLMLSGAAAFSGRSSSPAPPQEVDIAWPISLGVTFHSEGEAVAPSIPVPRPPSDPTVDKAPDTTVRADSAPELESPD